MSNRAVIDNSQKSQALAAAKSAIAAINIGLAGLFRERRLDANLSQQDVADMIGVKANQIHKLEQGENYLRAAQIFIIAKALNISPNDFFPG